MKSRFLLFLCLTVVFTVVSFSHAQDYEPIFEEDDCPFPELDGVTCGYLIVPEDRDNPGGTEVELAVAIIESTGSNVQTQPVIYLEGGPGGAALLGIEAFFELPLLQTHDVIVFDQRGTGFSYPSLNCYEIEEAEDEEGGIEECRDRLLDEGVDLNQYNTANSAADVEDLRIALGYDEVKLYGISYGTRLALNVIRDYPDSIHSVVIDSVYPPEIDDLELTTISRLGAFQALFDLCANDAQCNSAYPDLEDSFYDIVATLDDNPVVLDTDDGEFELFGGDVVDALFSALYGTDIVPYLPYALDLIANAQDENDYLDGLDIMEGAYIPDEEDMGNEEDSIMDSDMVQDYFDEYGDIDDSEGMAYSVDCSEEYALNDENSAIALAEQAPDVLVDYLIQQIEQTLADCDVWGVDTADVIEAQRVSSDVPVLIFSGAVDPVTPPSSGDSAALGLSNSRHIVFPAAGHGITFTDTASGECAKGIVVDFFLSPNDPVDDSCVAATSGVDFYVEN